MSRAVVLVLAAELSASSRGKACEAPYRAVLTRWKDETRLCISVEQPINGEWHGCSSWFLSTLLAGNGISDSISIDHGQQWSIDAGMRAAIFEAAIWCADNNLSAPS